MTRLLSLLDYCWQHLVQALAFLLLYFTPIKNFVHLVIILIAIDLLTGIYAAVVKEKKPFKASGLAKTLEKFIFYSIGIIVAFLLQKIVNDGTELPRIVAIFIGSIEVKSIYENLTRITGADFIMKIWEIIKSKIDNNIGKTNI